MSGLTTHVLDTAHGMPASGMTIRLCSDKQVIVSGQTNADGRCPGLLGEGALKQGRYSLEFHVADYFRAVGVDLPDPPFLDVVTIHFGVADPESHYHVPLLVSPYGYSTYRGS